MNNTFGRRRPLVQLQWLQTSSLQSRLYLQMEEPGPWQQVAETLLENTMAVASYIQMAADVAPVYKQEAAAMMEVDTGFENFPFSCRSSSFFEEKSDL